MPVEIFEGETPGPASIDLISLAATRELLQGSDSIPDSTVEMMITAASRLILNHTRREFVKGGKEAREFLARGDFLDLGSSGLRGKPSSVVLFTDLDEVSHVELTLGEYKLRPIRPEFGVYEWLELPAYLTEETQVTVEGEWGFEDVPADVSYWCGMTVVIWARGDISAFSMTFSIDEGRIEKPKALPPATESALRDYRRTTVG